MWGRHFKIRTDHVNLKYLLDRRVTLPSEHLWPAKLIGYDYEIEYRKWRENIIVDALFRLTNIEICTLGLSTISISFIDKIRAL